MIEYYDSQEDEAGLDLYQEIELLIRKNPWSWQSIGALTGLLGGVLAPFTGAALDIITWFGISEKVNFSLNVLSIISCAMTIPLLGLGAHCLDLLEARTARRSSGSQKPTTADASAGASTHVIHSKSKRPTHKTGLLALLFKFLTTPSQSTVKLRRDKGSWQQR